MKIAVFIFLNMVCLSCLSHEGHKTNLKQASQKPDSRWYSKSEVKSGKALYYKFCVSCHLNKAEGTLKWKKRDENGHLPPPPLNGSAHAWHHSRQVLRDYILLGGAPYDGQMPAFKQFINPKEANFIIAYFQSYWSDDIYDTWWQANDLD